MATGTHEEALPSNHHLKTCPLIENSQDFLLFFFFLFNIEFFRRSTKGKKETATFEQLPYQQNPRMPQPHVTASRISCSSFPNKWLRWAVPSLWEQQPSALLSPGGSLLSSMAPKPMGPSSPRVLHRQRTESFDTFLPRKPRQLPQTI